MLSLWLFWLSLAGIAYAWVGYPVLLFLLSRLRNRRVQAARHKPPVSLILTVHNEQAVIGAKLDNLLALDYPPDRLEIIVVSDCSTDATDRLVSEYADRGVILIRLPERGGKHQAQQAGVERARGEVFAFTDAAPLLDARALSLMMEYFADPEVGCVSSEDRVLSAPEAAAEERSYIRYLMALRRLESRVGSVVGLSGSFFAARRELCTPWWSDRSSDFYLALQAVRTGLRAVHHPESVHYYRVTPTLAGEFTRKRRTVLNGLVVLRYALDLLDPVRYGLFAWQLFSHKACRWTTPFFLLAFAASSVALAPHGSIYAVALALQGAAYLAGCGALWWPASTRFAPVRVAAFFVIGSAAVLLAWYDLLRGRTETIWNPTRR